jgi:hypothetical protein
VIHFRAWLSAAEINRSVLLVLVGWLVGRFSRVRGWWSVRAWRLLWGWPMT